MEGGETEKMQQNGEATNLALGKMDTGEGELMLSPAQTPQVKDSISSASLLSTVNALAVTCCCII